MLYMVKAGLLEFQSALQVRSLEGVEHRVSGYGYEAH